MPKIKAKQRPRMIKLKPLDPKHRKALMKLYDSVGKPVESHVLVGGVRRIKFKPLSKQRAEALRRLAEAEHEPINSKALFNTGRR